MNNIIFENDKNKGLTKESILYYGLVAILITVSLIFGVALVVGIDFARENLVEFLLAFFSVLFVSWMILLFRKC